MTTLIDRATVAFAALALAAGSLQCAEVNSLTLTPDGSNTDFVLTGVFGANAPMTAYSAPDTPYTLTFFLPTSPTDFQGIHAGGEIFAIDTSATLDGVTFASSNATFFDAAFGGGLALCLDTTCGPGLPATFVNFEVIGDQLYTGVPPSVTFIDGDGGVDPTQSYLVYATPEPSSAALMLAAVLVMILVARRRFGRKNLRSGM
jgi:hypothetical protein